MQTDFGKRVLAWYDRHGRKDLPWQQDRDAYKVWVSEIMLQQTQVQTVIPYYERFIASFPDIVALADADTDDVLQHWSGLGYYARARNLHRAAGLVRDEHGGVFPGDFDAVAALPGIGRSTAGAILSLAFGQRHPILDGNVKRVLARHAAIDGWPGTTVVAKKLWTLAEERTPLRRAGDYTQAIMDLGAIVCTRTRPACASCPVSRDCEALVSGDIERYPDRKPAKEKPLRKTTMLLAVVKGAVYLERRPASGIWGGLWSLPEVDDVGAWCAAKLDTSATETEVWDTLRHSFSHYDLDIRPVVVRLAAPSSKVADDADVTWYRLDESPPGGIAAPVTRLIETLRNTSGFTTYG
jgi:A/G-specific adenine glycosylase